MATLKVKIPKDIHFLILDDMETMRLGMEREIRELGFTGEISLTQSISQAWGVLSNKPVDFILSDWNLEGELGIDFLKKVREVPKFKSIPFVMITTEDDVSKILEAVRLGASNYIVKPWDKKDFFTRIITAWDMHHSGASL